MTEQATKTKHQLDQEWIHLMKTAKAAGLHKQDIKQFLKHNTA
ncbi:hypothetical protein ABID56_001107 [Alkalibacillus flavidus]|uniref:Sin domain-containing protein n=1 Tax=Alkalibacillus flavidus TaxID=546021 RepID=A0ABV2KTW1_9BACI